MEEEEGWGQMLLGAGKESHAQLQGRRESLGQGMGYVKAERGVVCPAPSPLSVPPLSTSQQSFLSKLGGPCNEPPS